MSINCLCSFTKCDKGDLNDETGRIEISASLPKKKATFEVNWSPNGDARFHDECFEKLLKSARSRNKKLSPVNLNEIEKSMIKEAAKTAEKHDPLSVVKNEALRIANMIKESSHCVAFTGAGISTSAGIGDYRGKSGKWTEMDRQAQENDEPSNPKKSKTEEQPDEGVPYEDLRPTFTHEALAKLIELNLVKHIISQNGDGLHLLSGIPESQLSELHGNVFIEKCEKCDSRYHRPHYVMDDHASEYFEELEDYGETTITKPKNAKQCDKCGLSHRTGRKCSKKGCKGFLMDTIINFRDNLEESILDKASDEAQGSDLMLCLGTTLFVTPANELVEMGREPLKIAICNRQKTYMDKVASAVDTKTKVQHGSRVFGDCDILMKEVMMHILPSEDYENWYKDRGARLEAYDKQRK